MIKYDDGGMIHGKYTTETRGGMNFVNAYLSAGRCPADFQQTHAEISQLN